MKRAWILCLFLVTGWSAIAQETAVKNFIIDPSEPYAYLEFDHIGPNPIQHGEDKLRLWLRFVNNCQIPIVFLVHGTPPDITGIILLDDVIANEEPKIIISSAEDVPKIEEEEKLREIKLKGKPAGYATSPLDVFGVARVQPGSDLLFSVPLNHVDDDWHMQLKFALEVNNSSANSGPFTYLSFYKDEIPKESLPSKN